MFLICTIALAVSAQVIDEKKFAFYSTKNGLSHNSINAIVQDRYGYLWIGTKKGLNRFDGSSFRQFYSDSNRNSLPRDYVRDLKMLDKEQLGVVIAGIGLHIINTSTLQSRNLIIPADSLKLPGPVNRIMDVFAQDGNTFLLTATGFYHFNDKDELIFRYDRYSGKYLETKGARFGYSMAKIENNSLLLSTYEDGFFLYNIKQKDLHPLTNSDDIFYQQIRSPKKLSILMHSDENSFSMIVPEEQEFSWFDIRQKTKRSSKIPAFRNVDSRSMLLRLNDSLFAINNGTNGFYLMQYHQSTDDYVLDPKLYFKNHFCASLFLDKKNRLWIATDQGLFHEKRSSATIEQITTPSQSPGYDSHIQTITVANNKVLAGTANEGLLVFDRDSMKTFRRIDFLKYGDGTFLPNIVNSIIAIDKDTFYVGVSGTWLTTNNLKHGKIELSKIDSTYHALDILFKDSRNNIYLKKGNKNIYYYRSRNDKKFTILDYDSVLASLWIGSAINLAEDPEGNIWFTGSGMKRLNYRLRKFDLSLDSFPAIKTGSKNISSNLVFDKGGQMYFGVRSSGLIIYDPRKRIFSQLTRSDGLPDNDIAALCLHSDKLWMGTESGLANYDLTTKKIAAFGIADGIPIDASTVYSLYYDSTHQQLYGAFKNTIFRFDPDKLTKNDSPPDFFIENIYIRGKEPIYHPIGKVTLSYKYNNLVVNLASVNFEDAYLQQFAYRFLKNGNEPWEEFGSQRSIILSNLSPGSYKLQVKVYMRSNSWPEQIKEIDISILPPFWKTAWFYIAIIFLLATVAYYLHRQRIKQITQKATVDKRLAQTEMKALHSQMNPHFIFNCLNSIREMILNNENDQASLYLSKFARLIRITLNHSSKTFVTLEDTIDYLQRYLEMEQIRKSNFTYTIDVDEDLQRNEILLPPMLIQPFIENAIWHGAPTDKEMHLTIKFKRKLHELVCIVDDDGIGIEASLKNKEPELNYQSVGIENIRQRIHVLNEKYNLKSTIDIKDKSDLSSMNDTKPNGQGTGTIVILHLSIKTNEILL